MKDCVFLIHFSTSIMAPADKVESPEKGTLKKRDRLQWSEVSFSIKGYKDNKLDEKVRLSKNGF